MIKKSKIKRIKKKKEVRLMKLRRQTMQHSRLNTPGAQNEQVYLSTCTSNPLIRPREGRQITGEREGERVRGERERVSVRRREGREEKNRRIKGKEMDEKKMEKEEWE